VFEWETRDEKVLRYSKIPPIKKLIWLTQMHDLILKASSKKDIDLRWKMRQTF